MKYTEMSRVLGANFENKRNIANHEVIRREQCNSSEIDIKHGNKFGLSANFENKWNNAKPNVIRLEQLNSLVIDEIDGNESGFWR